MFLERTARRAPRTWVANLMANPRGFVAGGAGGGGTSALQHSTKTGWEKGLGWLVVLGLHLLGGHDLAWYNHTIIERKSIALVSSVTSVWPWIWRHDPLSSDKMPSKDNTTEVEYLRINEAR